MVKRTKILVIGSGGTLLGNFIRRSFFLKKPYEISSIDKMDDLHTRTQIYINQDHSFNIADILDYHVLSNIIFKEEPEIIIHGAQDKSLKTNILGTKNVIDACLEHNKKLIFLSSSNIYKTQNKEISEEDAIEPISEFDIAKFASEMLIRNSGLKYTILRVGNYYGPWQKTHHFIPALIQQLAILKKDIELLGQGNRMMDWTHVYDICSALFSVIDNEKTTENKIYNLGAEQYFMDLEVAHIICNHLNFGHDKIKFTNHTYKPINKHISSKKIRNELNWAPEIKFKDGSQQVIQWFLNNKFLYELNK